MEKYLIKNTTRAQREQIVKDSLGYSDLGCEDCTNGYDMYQPYIDGEKEISEITQSYRTSYISEPKDDFRRHGCGIR